MNPIAEVIVTALSNYDQLRKAIVAAGGDDYVVSQEEFQKVITLLAQNRIQITAKYMGGK